MELEPMEAEVEEYLGKGKFKTKEGEVIELRGFSTDVDYIAKRIYESEHITIGEAYERAKLI